MKGVKAMNIEDIKGQCSTCAVPSTSKKELCPICITQKLTRGKWKFVIIWFLNDGKKRFSELQRAIPQIKQGPLTKQLRELESAGVINRKSYNVVPPKVEYSLTKLGKSFINVINAMDDWGKQYIEIFLS